MSGYVGRNSFMTPKSLRRGNEKPRWMSARFSREDGPYADSYANSRSSLGSTEEDLFLDIYDHQALINHANNVNFYLNEYNDLLSQMENNIPGTRTKYALETLFHVSELADEALYEQNNRKVTFGSAPRQKPAMLNIDDMLNWKQGQDQRHALFMLEQEEMCDKDEEEFIFKSMRNKSKRLEYTDRTKKLNQNAKMARFKTAAKSEPQLRKKNQGEKKPDCWHFMRGHCKRGKYCEFNHDSKHSYPDACKVFLGGLPFHITEAALREQLTEQGFNVVNKPKVYGGFSPQVCLASAAEATRLIKEGPIVIGGMNVDVRSYQPFTKKNQEKLADVSRRSVFLGGLRKGTTTQMIKKELEPLGLKIVNYPLIKAGFSPQVTLSTAKQALKLVNMVKVQINGALVDIRPYAGIGENA